MKIKIPNFKNISKATKIIKIFLILIFITIFVLPGASIFYFFTYTYINSHFFLDIMKNFKNKTHKIENVKYSKPKISIKPSIIPTPFLNKSEDYYIVRSYDPKKFDSNNADGDENDDKNNSYFYLEHRKRNYSYGTLNTVHCIKEKVQIYQENINISYSPVDLHQFIDKEVVIDGEFISFDYKKNSKSDSIDNKKIQQCIAGLCTNLISQYYLNESGYILKINSISLKK